MATEKLFLVVLLVAVIAIGFIVRPQASAYSNQLSQASGYQSLNQEVSF